MTAEHPNPASTAESAGHPSPTAGPLRRPELLAPAGDWDCVRAAVENGADAVYFGLTRFNARLRAHNFSEADLPDLMAWLHRRGVRGYVTFNTLVFTQELAEAESFLRTLITAGVDAAIVQDVGLCRLIRQISPDFPIHASTQMTITSAAGVAFARELGCQLVVVARENSIAELRRIQDEMASTGGSLPLEVFVHGALCVAYSGQCLTSEALGGRSANRGECAQACRLPYTLIADGKTVDLGDRRYLLSPQDLAGLDLLPDLVQAGVASLKIEGRLKSPEYVASITRVYRAALDRLATPATGSPDSASTPGAAAPSNERPSIDPPPATDYQLHMAFSRGLHTGWLGGNDNQRLVHGRFGKKRGAYLGRVTRVTHDRVWLCLEGPLKAGDGVVFDDGRPDQPEEGGRVFRLESEAALGRDTAIRFLENAVHLRAIRPGQRVWKTSDPELDRELRQTFANPNPAATRPVYAEVHGHRGAPLTLILRDEAGHLAQVESSIPLQPATRHPLNDTRLRDQLGRLGGTPFHLASLDVRLEGEVILPVSELNQLRRAAVALLDEARARPRRWTIHVSSSTTAPGSTPAGVTFSSVPEPDLTALVRNRAQLEAAIASGIRLVYCDFEDPKRCRDAVRTVRDTSSAAVFLAPPRIFKPGEDWILRQLRSAEPDGFLVRNYDHLAAFADTRCIGDFSLNIANPLSARHFIERYRLERVTASYDLNADQLEALLRAAPAEWFEVTLHLHMPMFHMEHCVFCAFLTRGKDYRDCGRPCDRTNLRLRDRVGAEHPVKADVGCRNTVFHGRAQTGAEYANRFRSAGARTFRLDFLEESEEQVRRLIVDYRRLLRGEIEGETLWREFRLINQLGVTRGQLGRATGVDLGVDRWTDTRAYAASW